MATCEAIRQRMAESCGMWTQWPTITTVDGVKGSGGSIDGPGPVIVGGMLYTNSGYGMFGGIPGNVLLAFSVDGK